MTAPVKVRSIAQLGELVDAGSRDFRLVLGGGGLFSRKTIARGSKAGVGRVWVITNHIDGTRQKLDDEELWTESNIGTALDRGALFCADPRLKEWAEATFNTKFVENRYPTLPPDERQLTDWYAGAFLTTTAASVDPVRDWDAGDAILTFSDIGVNEADDQVHGQLVAYYVGDGPLRAVSVEIDPSNARNIARRLLAWADGAKARKDALPSAADFDEARAKVTTETPCTGCDKPMPDEFTPSGFDGVMNNALQPFHHGCEDF